MKLSYRLALSSLAFTAALLGLSLVCPAPARATLCSVPYSFTNGTVADANQVNADFTSAKNCGNNVDNTNIGTLGIYASQIKPTTAAQATFGSNLAFTFQYGAILNLSPWYDPRAYGGKCDGVTDDHVAIAAMFAAIPNNGPAVAYIPNCASSVPTVITGKQHLAVVAQGETGANFNETGNGAGLVCTSNTTDCLDVFGSTIGISNFSITRKTTATAGCSLNLDGASHTIVESVVLSHAFNGLCAGSHAAPYGAEGDITVNEISGTINPCGKAISDYGNASGVVITSPRFGGPQDNCSFYLWLDPTQSIDTVQIKGGGGFGFGTGIYDQPNAGVIQADIFVGGNFVLDGMSGGPGIANNGNGGSGGFNCNDCFFGSFHSNDNCGMTIGGGNSINSALVDTTIVGFGRSGICVQANPPGVLVLSGGKCSVTGNGNTTPDTWAAVDVAAGGGHLRISNCNLDGVGSQDYAVRFHGNADGVVMQMNEVGGDIGTFAYGPGTLTNMSLCLNVFYTAPAQYCPIVLANAANVFTALQTFNAGIVAAASGGTPPIEADGGNYYSAPNLLAKGNNNPGIRITNTFGTLGVDGADWSIGAGQSNSGGADTLIFLDSRGATAQVAKLFAGTGNFQLLLPTAEFVSPAGSATSCVGSKFTNGVLVISGAGAPTCTAPVASMYLRSDGGVGSDLYISRGAGTWNAVAGV